jgi:hypothetical protein
LWSQLQALYSDKKSGEIKWTKKDLKELHPSFLCPKCCVICHSCQQIEDKEHVHLCAKSEKKAIPTVVEIAKSNWCVIVVTMNDPEDITLPLSTQRIG